MAYQRKKKRVRFLTTGEIVNPGSNNSVTHAAHLYKCYLKKLMAKLQNSARQKLFRMKIPRQPCKLCGEVDVSAFFIDYSAPNWIWLCQRCHKDNSQTRGTIYDQLLRHGVPVISWEDWKNGTRPVEV